MFIPDPGLYAFYWRTRINRTRSFLGLWTRNMAEGDVNISVDKDVMNVTGGGHAYQTDNLGKGKVECVVNQQEGKTEGEGTFSLVNLLETGDLTISQTKSRIKTQTGPVCNATSCGMGTLETLLMDGVMENTIPTGNPLSEIVQDHPEGTTMVVGNGNQWKARTLQPCHPLLKVRGPCNWIKGMCCISPRRNRELWSKIKAFSKHKHNRVLCNHGLNIPPIPPRALFPTSILKMLCRLLLLCGIGRSWVRESYLTLRKIIKSWPRRKPWGPGTFLKKFHRGYVHAKRKGKYSSRRRPRPRSRHQYCFQSYHHGARGSRVEANCGFG